LAAAKLRRRSRKVFRVFWEATGQGWLALHVARKEGTDKLKKWMALFAYPSKAYRLSIALVLVIALDL
jgi:hypothetical protein